MKTSPRDPISENVPERWFWHYQRLQAFREHLLDNRSVQIAEVSEPLEPHSMSMADSATDEFDHDLALGILSHEQNALYEVDAAIRRILDGSYGICEETGKHIPAGRLRAVPWTRFTREVEERLEQEGNNPA
jgi:RNA polymerase-binding transcription factor DksA